MNLTHLTRNMYTMKGARNLILEYLKARGITKKYLAEKLGESPQNLDSKFKKNDLTTDYIRRICDALDHDFFEDLSKEYRNETYDDWEKIMVEERPAAYSVTKDQEFKKWAHIIEKLPEELHYIRTQLEEIKKSKQ